MEGGRTVEPTAQQIANFETKYFKTAFVEKHGASFVSWKRLDKVLAALRKHVLDGAAEGFANVLERMLKRIVELEKTADELKTKQFNLADVYAGIWAPGQQYQRGQVCTVGGSLFLALVDNAKDKPGTSADWRLIVKAGRDGKDLR